MFIPGRFSSQTKLLSSLLSVNFSFYSLLSFLTAPFIHSEAPPLVHSQVLFGKKKTLPLKALCHLQKKLSPSPVFFFSSPASHCLLHCSQLSKPPSIISWSNHHHGDGYPLHHMSHAAYSSPRPSQLFPHPKESLSPLFLKGSTGSFFQKLIILFLEKKK